MIRVTAVDSDTGETCEYELGPGEYALITAEPAFLHDQVVHGNGTVVLTLLDTTSRRAVSLHGRVAP